MNRLTCVSGLRQEGKTKELVDEFKSLSKSLYCNQEMSFKTHFIICVVFDPNHKQWIKKFKDDYCISPEEIEFGSKVWVVDSKEGLLETLEDLVALSDCKVFIDDPDIILEKTDFYGVVHGEDYSSRVFEEFVDRYPNRDCGNSIDITYSRLRIKV